MLNNESCQGQVIWVAQLSKGKPTNVLPEDDYAVKDYATWSHA